MTNRTHSRRGLVRELARRLTALGALGSLVALAIACDDAATRRSSSGGPSGTVGLTISLPETEVTSVHFELSGNGFSRLGDIAVGAPGATASVLIGGVPAGSGYLLTLSAIGTDGRTTCAGSASLDVQANATTPLTVALQCRTPGGSGAVAANAAFNLCPQITSLAATPTTMSLGDQELISLTAVVLDLDGNPLTFAWTASAGTFDDATLPQTLYRCAAPGQFTVSLSVSDGRCQEVISAPIVCLPFCANKPAGTACNDQNACTRLDRCEAGQCRGGDPVVCTALNQCHEVGVCDRATGVCSNPADPEGTPCNDANACTRLDVCQGGECRGGNPLVCSAADQCHVAGACEPGSGMCTNPAAPNGTSCQLPNAVAACVGGSCAVSTCVPGTGNCNGSPVDGCETPVDTVVNCGRCGHACAFGTSCLGGLCLSPPPTSLATVAGGWKTTLTWQPSPGATSYDVSRGPAVTGPFQLVGTSIGPRFVDESVASGVAYFYVVAARNSDGPGTASAPLSAVPVSKQICMNSNALQSVLVFDASQAGAATPIRSIGGSLATFGSPTAVASSLSSNELFVMKRGGRVDVYPFGANGDIPPTRSLTVPVPPGLSVALAFDDVASEVYATDYRPVNLGGRVMALDATAGALSRLVSGESTWLGFTASLAIDRGHGEVFVSMTDDSEPTRRFPRIQTFALTDHGDVAPRRVLGGPANRDVGGWAIAHDRTRDQIFTSCNCDNRITVFARTAGGGDAPTRTLLLPPSVLSIYALLMDEGADSIWAVARTGAASYALMELPRGTNGNVSPLHAPIELATVGRLAPCN